MPSYKDEKTGKWYCSFYYTDLRGKRVRKMKRGFKFKRDADKWERDFLSVEHPEEILVDKLIDGFEKELDNQVTLGNIKRSTVTTHKNYIRLHIKPYFCGLMATRIMPKDIIDWLTQITYFDKNKCSTKQRRASSTINAAKNLLMRIFEYGVSNYGLKSNPVANVRNVKSFSNDTRATIWSHEQYLLFRQTLEKKMMICIYDIIYFAGLRVGEILALTPNDITAYKINVDKNLVYNDVSEKYIDTPKSKSSKRVVPIPEFLYDELRRYISFRLGLKPTDIIFNNTSEMTIRSHLRIKASKLNLPIISPHNLRHSYGSNMMEISKNPATVAELLGHSNPAFTLKVYTHKIPDADKEAVKKLEELNPNKK